MTLPSDRRDRVALLLLFAAGLLLHGADAWLRPDPMDWDPAYYRTIARHIASGSGATDSALWNLGWLPPTLPMPADLHWMPLASRVLVPFVWLWPAHGDQLATALLAAFWGPLAWLLSSRLGGDRRTSLVAGLVAMTGFAHARFLSTPDCIALTGALGSVAMLALIDGRAWTLAATCAALALTRNEGFLLAPLFALGLRGGGAILVAASGPLAAGLWHLRNAQLVGPDYWSMRALSARVVDTDQLGDLTLGHAPTLTIAQHVHFLLTDGLMTVAIVWTVAVPWLAWPVLRGPERWRRGLAAAWLALPWLSLVLAPGLTASGAMFRSAAVLVGVWVAGAAVAFQRLAERAAATDAPMAPRLAAVLVGVNLLWVGMVTLPGAWAPSPLPSTVCAELADVPAGAPVFSIHPILLESHCNRPAVLLQRGMSAEQVHDLSDRYGVHWALVRPAAEALGVVPGPDDAATLLPGWRRVSPTLYAR